MKEGKLTTVTREKKTIHMEDLEEVFVLLMDVTSFEMKDDRLVCFDIKFTLYRN